MAQLVDTAAEPEAADFGEVVTPHPAALRGSETGQDTLAGRFHTHGSEHSASVLTMNRRRLASATLRWIWSWQSVWAVTITCGESGAPWLRRNRWCGTTAPPGTRHHWHR